MKFLGIHVNLVVHEVFKIHVNLVVHEIFVDLCQFGCS